MSDLEQQISAGVTQALQQRSRRRYDKFMMFVVGLIVLFAIAAQYHG